VGAEARSGADIDPIEALRNFMEGHDGFDAVAHRMVHGGPSIRRATILDDAVREELGQGAALAPLHVPPALRVLDETRKLVRRPQVVCVDTAFHADLPDCASTYAVPAEWRMLGMRRYGFHGLSFAWASRRCAELLEQPLTNLHMVIAHVGAGVSACAVRAGRSVDTSMGFTPLEGAVMATRSGSIDPGALLWLQEVHGAGVTDLTRALEHESGLLALCGAADMREVVRGTVQGEPRHEAAMAVYVHALCRVIGGLATSLERLDALVFTGGVGENSPLVRSLVCRRLALLHLPSGLLNGDGDGVIGRHPHGAGPSVVMVGAREDAQMAREARALLRPHGHHTG